MGYVHPEYAQSPLLNVNIDSSFFFLQLLIGRAIKLKEVDLSSPATAIPQ